MQRCWDQDPQQNGVVERKNRTMLEAVKIKIFLCAYGQEAAMTVVYVQN
jgi:hypothetical protein